MTSINAAPGALAEAHAVAAVQVRYARALDTRDWDALATCFLPEARADYGRYGGELHGYSAIERAVRSALEPLDASQHLLGNHMLEALDGSQARASADVLASHYRRGPEGGCVYVIGGTYHDELVRTDGDWRIAIRRLTVTMAYGDRSVFAPREA